MKRQTEDHSKTKTQLIEELAMLRQQLAKLESVPLPEIERKRTENSLKESEERFSTTFSTSPLAKSVITQATNEIIMVNDACCRLFGYSREELIGLSTAKLNLWQDPATRLVAVKELQTTGHLLPREVTIQVKSGEVRTAIFAMEPISWQGIPCFITSVHDITELKQAQDALHRNVANQASLIDSTEDQMWSVDAQYCLIVGNASFKRYTEIVLGRALERGESLLQKAIPAELQDEWREYFDRALRGERFAVERSTRLAEQEHNREYRFNPIQTDGQIIGVAVSGRDITERKRAEEALRESEERLRLFIEYAPVSLAMFDHQMCYLAASMRWMTDYGLGEQPILGKSHYYIFPEISDDWKEVHRRGFAGEVVRSDNDKFVRRDGTIQWLKWEVHPWHLADGTVGGIIIFTEDITERKRAEEAILERERQMTALVTSLDDIVFEFDERSTYLNVWAGDENKLAQPIAQILGRRIEDVLGKEAGRPFTNAIKRVIADGRTEIIEYPLQVLDGQRWFMARISQIVGKDASHKSASMLIRDITERKQTDEKLHESQKLFQMLFSLGSVAYSLTSTSEQRIVDVNPACESLFGYTRAEIVGKRIFDIDFLEDPDELRLATKIFIKDGRLDDFEFAFKTKSGGSGWAICYANRIEQAGEKYVLSQFVNITERKQRERERETLLALATALRTATTRDEIIPITIDQIIRLMTLDGAAFALLDESNGESVIELARDGLAIWNHLRIPARQGITGMVIASGETYVTNDLKSDPNYYRTGMDHKDNMISIACAPLIADQKTIGALWIKSTSHMNDADVRLLEGIASMAATAIHRATLFEQTVQYASQLTDAYEKNIEGWSRALDLRDKETEGHTLRVTSLTVEMARAFGIPEPEIVHIRRGALLHDIGKMGVPDHILLKPGKLTDEEWVQMRLHPVFAHELLLPIEFLHDALDIPYCHHEKWDGTGYPRGLKGEEIPFHARIFAVVDVWDALTNDRPYRQGWSKEKALAYIQEQSGTHFDPKVVDVFVRVLSCDEC